MASAKASRKLFAIFLTVIMVLSLAACAGNTDGSTSSDSKILVAYFSHTGENEQDGARSAVMEWLNESGYSKS